MTATEYTLKNIYSTNVRLQGFISVKENEVKLQHAFHHG